MSREHEKALRAPTSTLRTSTQSSDDITKGSEDDFTTICYQNIQSLQNKRNRLEVLLSGDLQCEVLCMTEHWLRVNELQCVHINNFCLASSYCRPTIAHGGSCIYVKENISFKSLDYCTSNYCLSIVFVCIIVCLSNRYVKYQR